MDDVTRLRSMVTFPRLTLDKVTKAVPMINEKENSHLHRFKENHAKPTSF
jgi:hypothetical protein